MDPSLFVETVFWPKFSARPCCVLGRGFVFLENLVIDCLIVWYIYLFIFIYLYLLIHYLFLWIYLCWRELISVACVVILFFVIYSFTDSPICLAIDWIFVVVLLFCCFIHIQTSVYWCKSLSGKGDCLINFFVGRPIFC